jgi:hypothetical protein
MTPSRPLHLPAISHPHGHHSGADVCRRYGKRADMVVHGHDPFNAEPP